VREVESRIASCEYNVALATIWQQVLDPANRYIDRTKPFELAKKDRAACLRVLANLAEALRVAAILTKPFIPAASQKIYAGFNYATSYDVLRFEDASPGTTRRSELCVTAKLKDGKVEPLFPRIDLKA
jgi:methionyl-tRNA synthetase